MRRFILVLTAGLLAAAPALAQSAVPNSSIRAINTARNTAVKLNGGLNVYRPAQCMFATAEPDNPCMIANDSPGYTFRFQGGPPGWQVLNLPPTHESEIRISPDGRSVEKVIYNGPVR
jgi:hypothetical protein